MWRESRMGWDFRTWNLTICQPTLRLQISPATSDQSSGREKHRDDFKAGDRHSWIFFSCVRYLFPDRFIVVFFSSAFAGGLVEGHGIKDPTCGGCTESRQHYGVGVGAAAAAARVRDRRRRVHRLVARQAPPLPRIRRARHRPRPK